MFRPGTAEIVVGRSIARALPGPAIGETLSFARANGPSSASSTPAAPASTRRSGATPSRCCRRFAAPRFSSLVFRLADASAIRRGQGGDRRRSAAHARGEARAAVLRRPVGAAVDASSATSALTHLGHLLDRRDHRRDDHDVRSVASRTAEIGTLRALGFSRAAILAAFLAEALLLGLVGGVAGLVAASLMQALSISTTNFQTFAELAFRFRLTPSIVPMSLAFALAMGFVGGFLPAARAARMKIVDALRAA